jgi:hypothetical protein
MEHNRLGLPTSRDLFAAWPRLGDRAASKLATTASKCAHMVDPSEADVRRECGRGPHPRRCQVIYAGSSGPLIRTKLIETWARWIRAAA